jgi:hypothetical protein
MGSPLGYRRIVWRMELLSLAWCGMEGVLGTVCCLLLLWEQI